MLFLEEGSSISNGLSTKAVSEFVGGWTAFGGGFGEGAEHRHHHHYQLGGLVLLELGTPTLHVNSGEPRGGDDGGGGRRNANNRDSRREHHREQPAGAYGSGNGASGEDGQPVEDALERARRRQAIQRALDDDGQAGRESQQQQQQLVARLQFCRYAL